MATTAKSSRIRHLGRLGLAALAALMVAGLGGGCTLEQETDLLGTLDEQLSAGTSVTDGTIGCDGATSVEVSISGDDITSVTPSDIVLVLDDSGSISSTDFQEMKVFLKDVVNALDLSDGSRIGIVQFNQYARWALQPSGDQLGVLDAIDGLRHLRGYTCTGCGMDLAIDLLSQQDPSRARTMVVLTDGTANFSSANNSTVYSLSEAQADVQAKAAEAEAADIDVVAIGVGNVNPVQLDTMSDDVFVAASFADLSPLLDLLVATVTRPEATDVEVIFEVAPAFSVTGVQAGDGDAQLVGNTITWTVDAIQAETVTLSYDVAHNPAAGTDGDTPIHTSVSYSDAEGNELQVPEVSVVVVGCDGDSDGVSDQEDACLQTEPGAVVNEEGCSIDQLCPCDATWDNHGDYVACVAGEASALRDAGLIAGGERGKLVSTAAQASCGK